MVSLMYCSWLFPCEFSVFVISERLVKIRVNAELVKVCITVTVAGGKLPVHEFVVTSLVEDKICTLQIQG